MQFIRPFSTKNGKFFRRFCCLFKRQMVFWGPENPNFWKWVSKVFENASFIFKNV